MTFNSDWCVKPGDTLQEWCEENGLSSRVAATACGLDTKTFQGVLDGKRKLTPKIAKALNVGTGIPAQLWLNLEGFYRKGLAEGKVVA